MYSKHPLLRNSEEGIKLLLMEAILIPSQRMFTAHIDIGDIGKEMVHFVTLLCSQGMGMLGLEADVQISL